MVIDTSIIKKFFIQDFIPEDMDKVWHFCPNKMLWEAIRAENAVIISHANVLALLMQVSEVFVFPEPLPAFYQNQEAAYTVVSSYDFIKDFPEYIKTEPLYVLSNDFSWMIVFTTENTPDGEQLCVLVQNLHSK